MDSMPSSSQGTGVGSHAAGNGGGGIGMGGGSVGIGGNLGESIPGAKTKLVAYGVDPGITNVVVVAGDGGKPIYLLRRQTFRLLRGDHRWKQSQARLISTMKLDHHADFLQKWSGIRGNSHTIDNKAFVKNLLLRRATYHRLFLTSAFRSSLLHHRLEQVRPGDISSWHDADTLN
jgi:hypothetical protein